MKIRNRWFVGALLIAALVAVIWQLVPDLHLLTLAHWFGGGGLSLATMTAVQAEELSDALITLRDVAKKNNVKFDKQTQELTQMSKSVDDLHDRLRKQEKLSLSRIAGATVKGPRDAVSEECARFLAGLAIAAADFQGKLRSHPHHEELVRQLPVLLGVRGAYDIEQKAAMTGSDIPLPTSFGQEVVELVWQYGQARQFGTVYPCGPGTNKLPRLKTSPAFGFIDMSAGVPEKAPQVEYVEFNPYKAGGLVRIPSEIDQDNLIGLGQFLARYFARELAKWEDTVAFLGDGTATYKSISGVGKNADTLGKKLQLSSAKTAPADMTLTDLRNLRGQVDAAALRTSAYYCHLTHESKFVQFNNVDNGTVYIPNGPGGNATLDGFPIRWVGVMPVYEETARAGQYQVLFGDLSYYYMGVRGTPDLAVSRDVFFATDEIAMRGLERFDWKCLADASMAVLKLAAS